MRVGAVVFDIGNVLIQWDPRHLYRAVFASETEMEAFLTSICTMDWHIEHDRGVPFAENALRLKACHPGHADLIDLWGARYLDMTPGRVPGTAALLRRLKARGVAVHGLTNMPSPVFPALCERYEELLLLEHTVVSGDEGLLKPDPRIYEILIGRAGLDPSRTLFIDDSSRNVDAAATLGFHTHLFTDAGALEQALSDHGLIG